MKIHKFILLICIVMGCSQAVAQTSGGLPPSRKVDQQRESPPPSRQFPSSNQSEAPKPPLELQPFDPGAAINEGWSVFVGRSGVVDEKRAFDLTLGGIKSLDPSSHARVISVGMNNLSVFYKCAQDRKVRDYVKGENLSEQRGLNDFYSLDNLVWSVFLLRGRVDNRAQFFKDLKSKWSEHPVNQYVDFLGGKAPESVDHAYSILTQFADRGDAHAALRLGFRYECSDLEPDITTALRWYEKSRDLYLRGNASEQRIKSVSDRINRLRLILDGKFVR